jgi:hypothetical protein
MLMAYKVVKRHFFYEPPNHMATHMPTHMVKHPDHPTKHCELPLAD